LLIISAGMLAAFTLAHFYVTSLPLGSVEWAQRALAPAVNYACTGHFGNVPDDWVWPEISDRNLSESSSEYQLALFLAFRRAEFPCSLFPHDVPATFFLMASIMGTSRCRST
jgi:hypothetical protein